MRSWVLQTPDREGSMPSVLRQKRARTCEKWRAAQLRPGECPEWPQSASGGAQELLSAIQSAQTLTVHFKAPGGVGNFLDSALSNNFSNQSSQKEKVKKRKKGCKRSKLESYLCHY